LSPSSSPPPPFIWYLSLCFQLVSLFFFGFIFLPSFISISSATWKSDLRLFVSMFRSLAIPPPPPASVVSTNVLHHLATRLLLVHASNLRLSYFYPTNLFFWYMEILKSVCSFYFGIQASFAMFFLHQTLGWCFSLLDPI